MLFVPFVFFFVPFVYQQKDRSRSAYVTDLYHVDQNPVIAEIWAFFVIDPPSEALLKA